MNLHEPTPEYDFIIGIDEVGWGAIAGPVVLAGAVLPCEYSDLKLKDSKRFSTRQSRLDGAAYAMSVVMDHFIYELAPSELEYQRAGTALSKAQLAVANHLLTKHPRSLVVVDGKYLIPGLCESRQLALPKADSLVPAVSAASIIAKAHRDELMIEIGELLYPEWEFGRHKGYPTPAHSAKLQAWGPTRIHRLNVSSVREMYECVGWCED